MKHTQQRTFLVAVFGLAFLGLSAAIASAQSVFYVSPSGRNAWSGKLRVANRTRTDGPKATIPGARDAIRTLKTQGLLDPRGATVILLNGTYPVTSSIVFDSRDSGAAGAPITYRAENQGKAILDGGKRLTIWTSVSKTVAPFLKPEVRNKVLQCRLPQMRLIRSSVGDMVRMAGGSFDWAATPPVWLIYDGQLMPLARSSSDGSWLKTPDNHPAGVSNWFTTNHTPAKSYSFETSDMWVHGYFGETWADNDSRISSINPSTGRVDIVTAPGYGIVPGARYRFVNVLEELDSPGEWYLDRRNLMIYFYPPVRSTVASKTSLAHLTDALVKIWPSAPQSMFLNFEGLVFQGARGNGSGTGGALVQGRVSPSDVGFYGCTFRCGLRTGLFTGYGDPRRWTLESCDFTQLGSSGAVLYGGDRPTLTASGHMIVNCAFEKIAQINRTASVAIELRGVGGTVRSCQFKDLPHTVITLMSNDAVVENNRFIRCVYETTDSGAVYGGRDWTIRGVVVRNNVFQNILRAPDLTGVNPAACVYTDDGMSGWLVENNVFYNVDCAVKMNASRDNIVRNNVASGCSVGLQTNDWWRNQPDPGATHMDGLAAVPYAGALWASRYPELVNILTDAPNAMRRNQTYSNLFLSTATPIQKFNWAGDVSPTYTQTCTMYWGPNYDGIDPGFQDFPATLNLRANSNAASVGFVPWDMSQVGLRVTAFRANAPAQTLADLNP